MNESIQKPRRAGCGSAGLLSLTLLLFSGCGQAPPQHGVEFLVQVDTSRQAEAADQGRAVQQTGDILKKRLAKAAVRRAWVQVTPTNTITIQLPAKSAKSPDVRQLIEKGGVLEFRLVHPDSANLAGSDAIPEGYQRFTMSDALGRRDGKTEELLLKQEPEPGLSGNAVRQAMVMRDNLGRPQISFRLNPAATAAFAGLTRTNVGNRLAIVVDGRVFSAPRIMSPIEQGSGVIQGEFDDSAAFTLANALESPLIVPVKIAGERTF